MKKRETPERAKSEASLFEAGREALASILGPVRNAAGKVWDELAPAFDHGRSEAAAALFTGSAYVMYQKGPLQEQGQDQPLHGPAAEAQKELERELERDI